MSPKEARSLWLLGKHDLTLVTWQGKGKQKARVKMSLWVWNPASGRGWLCAFLIQGPGLLVTDVCPTAQTLGGGCRQSALSLVKLLGWGHAYQEAKGTLPPLGSFTTSHKTHIITSCSFTSWAYFYCHHARCWAYGGEQDKDDLLTG